MISAESRLTVKAYRSDVTAHSEIAATIKEIAADYGSVDVVVANAGVCTNCLSLEYDEDFWTRENRVSYDGVAGLPRRRARSSEAREKGNLLITASVSSILVNVPQTQAA